MNIKLIVFITYIYISELRFILTSLNDHMTSHESMYILFIEV